MKLYINLTIILLLLIFNSSNAQQQSNSTNVYISDELVVSNYDNTIYGHGYFGDNPSIHLNFTVGNNYYLSPEIVINYINSTFLIGIAPSGFTGYQDIRIFNETSNQFLYYAANKIYYQGPPVITELPTSQPIRIDNQLLFINGQRLVSAYGDFGYNPNFRLMVNVEQYREEEIYLQTINSTYFEAFCPFAQNVEPGFRGFKIYDNSNNQVIYDGSIYFSPTPSINITSYPLNYMGNNTVSGYGYFGSNPSELNITVSSKYYHENSIEIEFINSTFFVGIAPSGYFDMQDIKIYNSSNNELLYYRYHQIFYPSNQYIALTSQLYTYNGNLLYGYGYFGENPWYLTFMIGKNNQKKEINMQYIDSYSFSGYAPYGFEGYQDVIIYNYNREIVYYGQDMVYFYSNSSLSSSSSSSTPSPTPSIECEYSSYGFIINSTESIECQGTGPTYCETNTGSTCSTDSYNSTIKCTTGRFNSTRTIPSSFYCTGNNIECKSSYVTCSINKPQSSYLLVNGIEHKSNYYDHSNPQQQQQQDQQQNENNNTSSSTSVNYSSITILILFISTILITI